MVTLQLRQLDLQQGQSLLLRDVNWLEFEAILEELGEHRHTRIAYDHGLLEIMVPLPEHEYFKETIGDTVKDIAEQLDLEYESYGSTTWRNRAKEAGIEADNCFYFQNEIAVRGRIDLNLEHDPPPDLALEIDVTSKSLGRFPIYARLGVPEIWCYDSGILHLYRLQQDEYIEVSQSQIFPSLPIQTLPQLIEQHRQTGRLSLRRAVRAWVQQFS